MKDLTGQRYGRLTVIKKIGTSNTGHLIWECVCDCGKTIEAEGYLLKRGSVRSCGCLRVEVTASRVTTHGNSNTRLYRIWQSIKQRCENPNDGNYIHYGASGVCLCDEWHNFVNFRDWALQNGYAKDLSIDRIDTYGNYEPSNCRWVTAKVQNNNKKVNVDIREFIKDNSSNIKCISITYRCPECGYDKFFLLEKEGRQKIGLYCGNCGRYIKPANKYEIGLFEVTEE